MVLVRFTSATQHWQTCGVREQAWGGPATLLSHSGRWAQPFTGCYNDSLPDVANKAELAGETVHAMVEYALMMTVKVAWHSFKGATARFQPKSSKLDRLQLPS